MGIGMVSIRELGKQRVVCLEGQCGGQNFGDAVNGDQGVGKRSAWNVFNRDDQLAVVRHAVAFDAGKGAKRSFRSFALRRMDTQDQTG